MEIEFRALVLKFATLVLASLALETLIPHNAAHPWVGRIAHYAIVSVFLGAALLEYRKSGPRQ